MKKRFCVIICIVLIAFIAASPALYTRISNEAENDFAIVSVKFDSVTEPLLGEYKAAGCTAAVIEEEPGGGFSEEKLVNAEKEGLFCVLSVDAAAPIEKSYAEKIDEVIKKYDIEYLNVYGECEKSNEKNEFLEKIIEENHLTLVLTETKTQLSNERFAGYDECVESANGKVIRGYNSDKRNSLNKIDYDLNYFQMLNSLVDRNIRFFMVRTIEDKQYENSVNSERTLRAVERFSKKLDELGYNKEPANFSDYKVNRRLVSAASGLIMAVMLLLMLEWIFGEKRIFDVLAAVCGIVLALAALALPEKLLWVYPTLYSAEAPCFCITAVLAFVIKKREELSYLKLVLYSCAVAVLTLTVSCIMLSALLSGFDYFLNSSLFRGVKLSLITPILFSLILFLFAKGDSGRIKLKTVDGILRQYLRKRYVITAIIAFFIVGVCALIYLQRSGNAMIPFSEAYIRNSITDLILARPRTKEFIFAWPAFVLFLYYAKKFPDGMLEWIFAGISGMLFASVINTFCHVFTSVDIMYLRLIYGIIMAIPFVVISVAVNSLIVKIVEKIKK